MRSQTLTLTPILSPNPNPYPNLNQVEARTPPGTPQLPAEGGAELPDAAQAHRAWALAATAAATSGGEQLPVARSKTEE